jgi:MFS family permease
MDDRRVTPVAGVLSVVLFIVTIFVIESGDTPGEKATGAEIAGYFADNLGRLAIAAMIWGVGTIALIWFLDGLRARIAPASGQLARLAYGFGFAVALFMLATFTPDVAAAFGSDTFDRNLDAGAAEAMASMGDAFFFAAEAMLAGFFLAVGLAAIQARALPAWLGWISLVFAIVALIPPIGWAIVVWGFPLWILIVSVLFWRRPDPQPPPAL